jgi:hypothetical protein
MPDGDGQGAAGLDRLLEHLDSYFLVAGFAKIAPDDSPAGLTVYAAWTGSA